MGEDRLCKSSWPCPCMHACIYMNKMYISYSCKTTDHRVFSHGLITHQSIWHNTLVTTSLAMIIATIYCNHHTLVMRSSLLSIQYLSSSSIFITLMEPDSSVFEPMIVDTVPLPSNSSSGTSSSSNKSEQFTPKKFSIHRGCSVIRDYIKCGFMKTWHYWERGVS